MQAILVLTRCALEPLDLKKTGGGVFEQLGDSQRDCCHVPEARLRQVTKLSGVPRVDHGHRSVDNSAPHLLGTGDNTPRMFHGGELA